MHPKEPEIMKSRIIGGVLAATTVVAVTAGCSDASTARAANPTTNPTVTSTLAASDHNVADVAFVQGMIPHHSQAVTMSGLAATRAASPQVKDLATRIARAQGPEIQQMIAFLTAWGAPASGGMTAMSGMPGMMSDQQMSQLGTAAGSAFDRTFLQMMTEHHRGAISMAQTELAQGQNPEARTLAEKIIADQQAEIAEMQGLLAMS